MTNDSTRSTRRAWIAALTRTLAGAGAVALVAALRADDAHADAPATLVVYKDAGCGCCRDWVAHLRKNGLKVDAVDRTDMDALKDSFGVPTSLRSCHTAIAGRYVIEGHVPASDIRRFLAHPPANVAGLAVPGMPSGSPGMEAPGRRAERYDVIAYSANGTTRVFARHG